MSGYFIIESGRKNRTCEIMIVDKPEKLEAMSNIIAWKLLELMKTPQCPIDLARALKIHEQKVYYHIRKLRDAGIIEEVRTESRHGTVARFYEIKSSAIGTFLPGAKMEKITFAAPRYNRNMEPFIVEGRSNFTIVVGSPEPHGPFRARASDAMCAIDLGLFLGSFTTGIEEANYKLDVEIRERDLKQNLIIIGGPVANMITKKINEKMPIKIMLKMDRSIFSALSKKYYDNDASGYIIVTDNPWAKGKRIMVLAGKRFIGTRAAVLFLIKKFDKIFEGNRWDSNILARVVRGYDMDGDGIIDTAELIE
ncbi:MAG: S-layer protein [Candidatus Aenigmarchaeota archaeon]|nr:S-layer protein [Candidatus Aenigmarchaeota archaeon]